jgi:peptide-methionine (S)-S-oxide reductase
MRKRFAALILFRATTVFTLLAAAPAYGANEPAADTPPALETAIFAGGCFWCVEADFDKVPGVTETLSGYTGGHVEEPSYKQVTKGGTGHIESVRISFDPAIVSYDRLLYLFWRSVDPLDEGGQFCDRGTSYTTAIFTVSSRQRAQAEASKAALETSGAISKPAVTTIRDAATFWPAETYHQDYYNKNPIRYNYYRTGCGRDRRLKTLWGKDAWTAK